MHGRDGLSCHYLFARRLGLSSTGCRLRGRATTALLIEEHTTAANGLESARTLGASPRMLRVARNRNGRARLHLAVGRCILRRISILSGSGFLHSGLLRTGLGDRSRGLRERLLRITGTAGRLRTGSLGCGGLHGALAINRGRLFGFTFKGFTVMRLIITVDARLLVIVIIFRFATIKTLTQGIGQTKTTRPPGHTTQYGKNHEP